MAKVMIAPTGMTVTESYIEFKSRGHLIRMYMTGDHLRITSDSATLLVQPEESRSLYIVAKTGF